MDTHTVVIGYDTKLRGGKEAHTNLDRNFRQQEIVDVYNDDCFITSIPLKVLVRFSSAAAETFARPSRPFKPTAAVSAAKYAASSMKSGSEAVASDSDASSSKGETASTHSTEITTPSPQPTRIRGKKQLILIMDGAENPSNETVMWTLKWMMDNAEAKEDLIPYAPDVNKLGFEQLIDFYQTSLVLGVRPIPRHITGAIMRRLSDQPPTLGMFQALADYIPVGNVVIDRAINSYHHHWCAGHYLTRQLDAFEEFMNAEGNELFRQRYDHIFGLIAKKKAKERSVLLEVNRGRGNNAASNNWRQSSTSPPPRKEWRQESRASRKDWSQWVESGAEHVEKSGLMNKVVEPESGDAKAEKLVSEVEVKV